MSKRAQCVEVVKDVLVEHGKDAEAVVKVVFSEIEEPTRAMMEAGLSAGGVKGQTVEDIARAWSAMLAEAKR